MTIKALLFDLDGTLIDTAPDLIEAVQLQLERHQQPRVCAEQVRPAVPNGAGAIVQAAFGVIDNDELLEQHRQEFFDIYQQQLLVKPLIYPGLETTIEQWEKQGLPWGIVTNKPARFTEPMLAQLGLDQRLSVLVCGDTLEQRKPHPLPLTHAASELGLSPGECLYVGDDERDVIACDRAGMPCVTAAWDFIPADADPETWGGVAVLDDARQLGPTVEQLRSGL